MIRRRTIALPVEVRSQVFLSFFKFHMSFTNSTSFNAVRMNTKLLTRNLATLYKTRTGTYAVCHSLLSHSLALYNKPAFFFFRRTAPNSSTQLYVVAWRVLIWCAACPSRTPPASRWFFLCRKLFLGLLFEYRIYNVRCVCRAYLLHRSMQFIAAHIIYIHNPFFTIFIYHFNFSLNQWIVKIYII